MEITDNIIIYEAQEIPHFLMQPFYSDYVGIVICHQGMFRFCVDGTSFVASMGESVFLSPGILLQVQETSSDFRFTLLFYRVEQIRHMLGNTVVSMRLYSTLYPSACTVAHSSLPDANIIETSSVAMISTSHPYEVRQEKLWHYKVSEVTKQALESYLSSYLTAYNQLIEAINTAILDDSATEEELNEINQKFGQYNTALAKIKAAIESVHTDISSDAAAEAVEYARANLKVTADEIAAEVERATSAEEKLKGSIKVTSDDITAEVSRATKAEEELRGSIKVNADAIKLKVTSKDVGSLIEQKADSIRLKASKISWESTYSSMTESGALTCKNATIKGTIYSENGKDIVRLRNGRLDICYNGVEIGLIGGNGLDGFSDKEGLNFDLEYTGDYMTWAAQSSPNSKYGMKWTYARSNFGNFTGDALNAGCDIDMHYHKIQRAKFSKITAENGYNGWTGEIPIITRIVSNNDGSISWWESSITVSNGIITSAPR